MNVAGRGGSKRVLSDKLLRTRERKKVKEKNAAPWKGEGTTKARNVSFTGGGGETSLLEERRPRLFSFSVGTGGTNFRKGKVSLSP